MPHKLKYKFIYESIWKIFTAEKMHKRLIISVNKLSIAQSKLFYLHFCICIYINFLIFFCASFDNYIQILQHVCWDILWKFTIFFNFSSQTKIITLVGLPYLTTRVKRCIYLTGMGVKFYIWLIFFSCGGWGGFLVEFDANEFI